VPLQGTFTRTPWTRNAARRAKQVIVAFRRRPPMAPVSPPPTLRQFGRLFRLVDPHWYDNESYTFALYARGR